MDSIQLLSVVLKCSAKADAGCRMQDAGCWGRLWPDVFSEEEQRPILEFPADFLGCDRSLLDAVVCYRSIIGVRVLFVFFLVSIEKSFAVTIKSSQSLVSSPL